MRTTLPALAFLLLSSATNAQAFSPVWGGPIGGSAADRGYAIALDNAGHVHLAGTFNGTIDVDPGPGTTTLTSAGMHDVFIAKFDISGALVWARSIGGAHGDGVLAMTVDEQGNVYTTGGFCGTADFDPGPGSFTLTAATTGQSDIFISKLDANGDFVWAKGVVGGTWWDQGYGIAIDPAGNVVVTGRFYYQGGPRDFDPGPDTYFLTAGHEDIFVLKLDADGNFLWAVDLGIAPHESRGYSIALDAAGNIFATGYFRGAVDFDPGPGTHVLTSVGTWNIFHLKLDPNGALVWVNPLPISTTTYHNDPAYGRKITIDTEGNLLATGRFAGTIDFDPGAGTTELSAVGSYDIYVAKYSNAGAFMWAKAMGGNGHDEGFSIGTDDQGRVLVAGSFSGTADFDPGPDALELTAVGGADMFVLLLDADGELVHAGAFGGTAGDQAQAIAMSGSGDIYCTGWFSGSADLDPGNGTLNVVSAGSEDAFLMKLVLTGTTSVHEPGSDGTAFTIFPNPTSSMVNIAVHPGLIGEKAAMELVDATGRLAHSTPINALMPVQPMTLPASLVEGCYTLLLRVHGAPIIAAPLMIQH